GKVADGTSQLVEQEAKARQQALVVQRDLQAERAQLATGWNKLESERTSIAAQRRNESFLAALVTGGGGVLAGLISLGFAWLTMYGLSRDDSSQAACEILIEDLVA